jgi:hypothetical protein
MADKVGMQLEISANAKGVTATLKDAQGAIVQTASVIKSQLGGASNETGKSIGQLKEGLGKARETAMFFTASLGEFGPAGRTAQIAISGIAGAIMGGGGILLALEGLRLAVRLITAAWEEEAKAAEEAQKKAKEAAEAAARAAMANADAVTQARNRIRDQLGEFLGTGADDIKKAISESVLAIASMPEGALKRMAENRLRELREFAEQIKEIEGWADEPLKPRRGPRSLSAPVSYGEGRSEKQVREDAARTTNDQADAQSRLNALLESAHNFKLLDRAETDKILADDKAATEERIRNQLEIAQAMGQTVAAAITGQQSLSDTMKSVANTMLQIMLDLATKQIKMSALKAGGEAASSQAGVPIAGPALAIVAMTAMIGTVQALIGNLPSAAGGAVIPMGINPVFQLHEGEHVIPKRIARNYERGGPDGYTLNIYAQDARTFEDFFRRNDKVALRVISDAIRDRR